MNDVEALVEKIEKLMLAGAEAQNNKCVSPDIEVYPIVKTIFGATYVWSEGLTVTCSLPSPS
jgi:hypothetical protein